VSSRSKILINEIYKHISTFFYLGCRLLCDDVKIYLGHRYSKADFWDFVSSETYWRQ